MLVLPKGLLDGERLATCSDAAQLHFPRLAALTNGFGRIELNFRSIIDLAYKGFNTPPTRDELTGWIREYAKAQLLFVYEAEDGTPWGQWRGIPDNMLPRFKTSAEKRSPMPPAEDLKRFDEVYANLKKNSGDFLNLSADFGNVPKCSEDFRSTSNTSADEVVDEVVDEGKQLPSPPSRNSDSKHKKPSHQKKVTTVKPYDQDFTRAYDAYRRSHKAYWGTGRRGPCHAAH